MSALPKKAQAAGGRVGRFQLRRELGRGAQATVWLAFDPRLQREVAVKVIDPSADAASVAQWLDEARAVSRLSHPNIVPVFEADQEGATSFLVFEYVQGMTLAEVLHQRGRLPQREAATLVRDILDAVATAHAQDIVHRDLKPTNILLDAQGHPRVMDFGIAARLSARHDGRIVGTPGYISPEAIEGAAPHPLMDVFAAGMMLGQMLCGRPLLDERDPYRALLRIVSEDIAWPANTVADRGHEAIDDALRTLVMRAVARDPGARHASARAFRDGLHRWLEPDPVGSDGGDAATLEFLLRRMRHKSDFPALSDAVGRIQRVTRSEGASLAGVTDEIARDVALTHKLLRLVNTAHFRNAGAGTIASIPRAVSLVGLSGIRTMALSLVLLEHMQDKQHVQRLKEVFLLAMMAGTLADELTPSARAHDEPFLAGMMGQLGRLLTEFYFPDEATLVRQRADLAWQRGEWTQAFEDRAVIDVLGITFEQLGVGVAKAWDFPDSLRRAMARPSDAPPARAAVAPGERLRWTTLAAGDVANTLLQAPQAALPARLGQLADRYARALDLPRDRFEAAIRIAQSHLTSMAADLGIDLRADAPARRLLALPASASFAPTAPEWPAAGGAPGVPVQAGKEAAAPAKGGHVVPIGDGAFNRSEPTGADAAAIATAATLARMRTLEDGIARVTDALAGDSFRLNEVLRAILEAMQRALGFRCIVFGLRDPKSGIITGRFGLGEGVDSLVARFRVDVNANGPVDLLTVACRKATDTLISDATAENVRSRLPTWLQQERGARSFVLLPLTMKRAPFGLIYADAAATGAIVLEERELSLLRTLRNQAVMAFKTAA